MMIIIKYVYRELSISAYNNSWQSGTELSEFLGNGKREGNQASDKKKKKDRELILTFFLLLIMTPNGSHGYISKD